MHPLSAAGHEFDFSSPEYLRYRAPGGGSSSGTAIQFPYKKGLRLHVSSWTGRLTLRYGSSHAPLSPLDHEQLGNFLREFFRQWSLADAESARKAAFDYSDAQRGFVPLAFGACMLVALPVAIALLSDSHQQFRCTRELRENSVPALMHAVKARKQDSRTFLLNFEFKAPSGETIKGQEVVLTQKDVPPPMDYPMLYSPTHPECWSLTKSPDNPEVNWAKRRYFAWFGLLFGIFFLAVTVLGLSWCVARWARPRPFADEVAALAGPPA